MSLVYRQEVENLELSLGRIKAGEVPEDRYHVFFGERGMGKTTLLEALAEEYLQRGIPHALISVSTLPSGIAGAFSDFLGSAAKQLEIPSLTVDVGEPSSFAESVRDLAGKNPTTPVAVLVDDFDRLSEAERNRIQREVFAPLVDEKVGNVVIAATVTDPIGVPRFDLRRILRETSLQPFTTAETAIQVGDEQLGAAIQALTFGLPRANEMAKKGANRREIVSALLPDKQKREQADEVAVAASAFRRFSHFLAREVMAVLEEKSPEEISTPQFLELTEDLTDRGLIHWDPSPPPGFCLYPTTRRIAAEYFEEVRPDSARAMHLAAGEYYKNLLKHPLGKDDEWQTAVRGEIDYHAAALQRLT